jgi:hypothetical protein
MCTGSTFATCRMRGYMLVVAQYQLHCCVKLFVMHVAVCDASFRWHAACQVWPAGGGSPGVAGAAGS